MRSAEEALGCRMRIPGRRGSLDDAGNRNKYAIGSI